MNQQFRISAKNMSRPSRSPACFPFPKTDSWFEVRVFYVRVSNCNLEKAPESLAMLFPPHNIAIYVELNGARIPPSEEFSLTLRRNQVDVEVNDFVIYVSTDNIRISSTIQFLVKDRDTLLVSGTLQKLEPVQEEPNPLDSHEDLSSLPKTFKMDWTLESASEVDWQGCAFVKARQDSLKKPVHYNSPMDHLQSPAMEVCVSGTLMDMPAILTHTVQLTVRRRPANRQTLNVIPEDDESPKSPRIKFLMDDHMKEETENERLRRDITDTGKAASPSNLSSLYGLESDLYMSNQDPDDTWNSRGIYKGIKVGLGIGLGMCIGIGIGLGLIIRTYRVTAKPMNKGSV